MNNKQFISEISSATGASTKDVTELVAAVCNAIKSNLKENDSVAIPGFGKFEAVKEEEKISVDLSTGKRLLLPPVINVIFTPASSLVKSFGSRK